MFDKFEYQPILVIGSFKTFHYNCTVIISTTQPTQILSNVVIADKMKCQLSKRVLYSSARYIVK